DLLAPGDQPTLHAEAGLELVDGPAQHLLVLHLFLGEAQQRPEPGLVAVDGAASAVDHHRYDVLLDEGEDVAVAVATDLVQETLLVAVEEGEVLDAGDAFRQERSRQVEVAAVEAVINRPSALE